MKCLVSLFLLLDERRAFSMATVLDIPAETRSHKIDTLICHCIPVRASAIRAAIDAGATEVAQGAEAAFAISSGCSPVCRRRVAPAPNAPAAATFKGSANATLPEASAQHCALDLVSISKKLLFQLPYVVLLLVHAIFSRVLN